MLSFCSGSYRPLSLDGQVESQENKKLCFCTASLALNSRLGEACRAKTKFFILLRLNMAAEWQSSILQPTSNFRRKRKPKRRFAPFSSRQPGWNFAYEQAAKLVPLTGPGLGPVTRNLPINYWPEKYFMCTAFLNRLNFYWVIFYIFLYWLWKLNSEVFIAL